MVASGIYFFDVNENGTGIYKVKVDSYMTTSQNDSSGFHTKKIFLKIVFYYFKIWNAKHKLNAVNANITKAENGEGCQNKLIKPYSF